MILKNPNLFDLPESFTIEVPEVELQAHLERASKYNGFELLQSRYNPKHCHALRSNLDLTKPHFWDSEDNGFIAFEVEFKGNSIKVLKSSLGGAMDIMLSNVDIISKSIASGNLFERMYSFQSRYGSNSPNSLFTDVINSVGDPKLFCKDVWYKVRNLETYNVSINISPRIVGNDR
jgi:hypothetical protein